MTPAELQKLLTNPSLSGVCSAERWAERPYGLVVALQGGGSVYWAITGAQGFAAAPEDGGGPGPQPVPNLAGGKTATADVEQALLAALMSDVDEGHVVRVERYSTGPNPPTFRYGATIDCRDTWRLFITCVGTARAGEHLRESRHYQPDSEV
ncbi:hypothetical protein ACIQF6_28110 [Kitasatospora sp. NPDC092948]|uniref:hypothetical protein n=1 Tax=Kitasatospora sp. NPDC092948 TaxID=3364088 RepID=UPI00380E36BC